MWKNPLPPLPQRHLWRHLCTHPLLSCPGTSSALVPSSILCVIGKGPGTPVCCGLAPGSQAQQYGARHGVSFQFRGGVWYCRSCFCPLPTVNRKWVENFPLRRRRVRTPPLLRALRFGKIWCYTQELGIAWFPNWSKLYTTSPPLAFLSPWKRLGLVYVASSSSASRQHGGSTWNLVPAGKRMLEGKFCTFSP